MTKDSTKIQGDEYGVIKYKNGKPYFDSYGKAAFIYDILTNIEDNSISIILRFDYLGKAKMLRVPREIFTDTKLANTLASQGIDINRKTYDIFIDSLRIQEDEREANNNPPTNIYSNLGWFLSPKSKKNPYCFRSHTLIGEKGTYIGDYDISPHGDFEKWKDMVRKDILGDPLAEIVLLASLSSVLIPVLSSQGCFPGNPIVHIFGASSSGKSTYGYLAASTGGEPYDGSKVISDAYNIPKTVYSLYRSWGVTANALVGSCSGNHGYPIILNELGKCLEKDLTSVIYNISEGSDKLRYNQNMQIQTSLSYATAFISIGEHSLLERCKEKAAGLNLRILELEIEKTPNGAARSDRIKKACQKNNGFAIPALASYILKNNCFKAVHDEYQKQKNSAIQSWIQYDGYERFVSKYVALFLATAEIASKALKLSFNAKSIKNYLYEYDKKTASTKNPALKSYEILIEEFLQNRHRFITDKNSLSFGECWGKIEKPANKTVANKKVAEQISVLKTVVEALLQKHGYKNINTSIHEWKKENLIDYENGKNTRKRKIHPSSPSISVYVFNVFNDTEDSLNTSPVKKRAIKNNIVNLLKEDA